MSHRGGLAGGCGQADVRVWFRVQAGGPSPFENKLRLGIQTFTVPRRTAEDCLIPGVAGSSPARIPAFDGSAFEEPTALAGPLC